MKRFHRRSATRLQERLIKIGNQIKRTQAIQHDNLKAIGIILAEEFTHPVLKDTTESGQALQARLLELEKSLLEQEAYNQKRLNDWRSLHERYLDFIKPLNNQRQTLEIESLQQLADELSAQERLSTSLERQLKHQIAQLKRILLP